jgi:hypothetical protein
LRFNTNISSFRGKAKELSARFTSDGGGSSVRAQADAFGISAAGIQLAMTNIASVVSIHKPAPDDIVSSKAELEEAVNKTLDLDRQARVDQTEYVTAQAAVEASVLKFVNIPIDDPKKPWEELTSNMNAMKAALEKATSHPYSADEGNRSALGIALADYCAGIQDELDQKVGNMMFSYTCRKGAAGAGGKGASPDQPGAPGTAGKPGKTTVKPLNSTDQDADLEIPVAYAHPDQCQMLSNIADYKYLSAKGSAEIKSRYAEARDLYERLKKRLAFIPTLGAEEERKNTTSSTKPLLNAYIEMESQYLTLDSLAQLSQLRLHAEVSLSRIDQGHDMFDNTGLWAPRLNYNFYTEWIEKARTRAKIIAQAIEDAGPTVNTYSHEESLANAKAQLIALTGRLRALTERDSGTLATIATQVKAYTPLLKAKRVEVKDAIEKASDDIDKSINWDPKIAIDAISMIALAPDGFNTIAQLGGGIYKGLTTVRSADGSAVEKTYVVEQFGEVSSDISKLQHTLSQTSKGEMAVDDPGATKLLASKAEINKLIKNYKLAISKKHLTEVRFLFDQYVDLALHRNNAVMEYNANVQVLLKVIEDQKYYQKRLATIGQVKTITDTRVYTLKLFLAKSRYDIRKTIHEVLYNAERALQFWSLCDDLPAILPSANFSDISLLEARCEEFEAEFKKAKTRMAGNPGSIFPHPEHPHLGGIRWEMPTIKVADLRNKTVDANKNTVHEVMFSVLPAREKTKKLPKREPNSPVPIPSDLEHEGLYGAAESNFHGMADVRIDQVKAWLFGAKVDQPDGGPPSIQCTLEHLGDDYIVRGEGDKIFEFNHGITKLKWKYNPIGVEKWEDTSKAAIFEEQLIPSFHGPKQSLETNSVAPIGPFATWRLRITDQHNLGLNLENLKAVTLEFCGSAASF